MDARASRRLALAQVIWLATVRPPSRETRGLGRPHLVPLWFVWVPAENRLYLCTPAKTVKARNLQRNPYVSLALEDGWRVLIVEGVARRLRRPPAAAVAAFLKKYEWDIRDDETHNALFAIEPQRVLSWQA